jgi:hypothetical protein
LELVSLKGIKHRKKITNGIKDIIQSANAVKIDNFFDTLKEFRELAAKIPEQEQENYEMYVEKHFKHEFNLLRIEYKKIEMNYKDTLFRTDKRAVKFETNLADKNLNKDMRDFYRKEYLNILKPMYYLEQMLENYRKYQEVLKLTMEEFSEWFFLGRIDFLKQLLQPFIVIDDSRKGREIWIYKKYEKELTKERKQKMYKRAQMVE